MKNLFITIGALIICIALFTTVISGFIYLCFSFVQWDISLHDPSAIRMLILLSSLASTIIFIPIAGKDLKDYAQKKNQHTKFGDKIK